MDRLFLDSNVLFTAAHNPAGKAALLLWLAAQGCWRAASSEHAIEEARRNLGAKYPEALERFVLIRAALRVVGQPGAVKAPYVAEIADVRAGLPPQDRLILDAALGCGATHLLTGDVRHLGALMNAPEHTAGLMIQTVSDYLRARTQV